MHEYDITLKRILSRLPGRVLAEITGFAVERWHNVELKVVRESSVDMLGETTDGQLVHIELQSTNDSRMAARMLEYAVDINRQLGRFPEQIVLYFGNAPIRMESRLGAAGLTFECRIIDIRELDGEPYLASERLEENVVAILMRIRSENEAVQRILARIAAATPAERGVAFEELTILAGLRKLGAVLKEEARRMPITEDIMDHEIIGPAIRQGIAQGRQEGRQEGERAVILRLIGKRFGQVPEWARQRLDALAAADLEQVELRLLDAGSLEELLA